MSDRSETKPPADEVRLDLPVGRPVPERDEFDGQFGESGAPDKCPECEADWFGSERLRTGDDKGIGGWEDWMYCAVCECDMFFPVTHRPKTPNVGGEVRLAAHQPSQTTTATPQGVASTDQLGRASEARN